MPTELQEIKQPSPTTYSNYSRTKKAYLKKQLFGTVCFPIGIEFGCGRGETLEKDTQLDLKSELSPYDLRITLETPLKLKEPWSYNAQSCEWCNPEVCYGRSTVSILECHSKINLFAFGEIVPRFIPGSLGYHIEENCTGNDPRCNCDKDKLSEQVRKIEKHYRHYSTDTYNVIIIPVSFSRNNTSGASSPAETADAAKKVLMDEPLYDIDAPSGMNPVIGILNPSGNINWIYPAQGYSQGKLSLLSRNCIEFFSGGNSTFYLDKHFLPVLAATQPFPNSIAEASLTFSRQGKDFAELKNTAEVRTELFTIVWTEFDLNSAVSDGISGIEDETRARLQIKLRNKNDNSVIGQLTENYILLQPP